MFNSPLNGLQHFSSITTKHSNLLKLFVQLMEGVIVVVVPWIP